MFKLANDNKNIDPISIEELLIVLKHFRNKKTQDSDGINKTCSNPAINKTIRFDKHVLENRLYTR
jgi:hypothetical protein